MNLGGFIYFSRRKGVLITYHAENKLELCAFARKGEHNVYSLVFNIADCMYIYIDTKFSYDNNVYFSIFCEHRQLKHGIHVVYRPFQRSFVTLHDCTSGFMWLKVVLCGFMWEVVLCG